MTNISTKTLLTSIASLALVLAGAVAPAAAADNEGCGDGGAVGQMTLSIEPDSGLQWVTNMNVAATLCADGTAVGGGRVDLILDYAYVNADPKFELPVGTRMTFWYSPFAWVENVYPLVAAEITPIGQFRRQVLEALDGDKAALEDWMLLWSSPYPEGYYDIDGDGDGDLRINFWFK